MIRLLVSLFFVAAAAGLAPAAGPAYWDSPERIAFIDGELRGAGLDPDGSLVPGLAAETVMADSSLVLWTAVRGRDGSVWAGSGHDGLVWRIDRRGAASLVADLEAEEVFALLADDDGLLVGCGPGGQIFRITRGGDITLLGRVPGGYAWDLERAPDGTVYVAAGSPAAVYRLADDTVELVAELPASNALDLAVRDDGSLLVAAQGPGRVFRVLPDSRRWALVLAMDQDEGRQVVRGPDGWYALGYQAEGGGGNGGDAGLDGAGDLGMGPFDIMVTADADVKPVRSALYRLDEEVSNRVWSSELVLTCVAWSDDHGWLGAGQRRPGQDARIYALDPPNGRRPVAGWEGGDVLELVLVPRDAGADELLAVQAHPGLVTRLRVPERDQALALSPPLDGRQGVRWGRLTWRGLAGGGQPRFSARAGMSPRPDESWSPWSDLGGDRDLDLGKLPAARYLQWRVALAPGSRVDAVTVSGFEPNLAPGITHFELQPDGEMYRGGLMQGPENVTQRFPSGMQVEINTQSRDDRRLDRDRAALLRPVRALTWHASDPNEDRLEFQLFQRREGGQTWLPVGETGPDQVRVWDTGDLADGWYELRLVVSDHADNPGDLARTAERVMHSVPVDNTPPRLDGWKLEHQREGFSVQLEARDEFGPLAGAELRLPDGTWQRLDPRDGICDSAREKFAAEIRFPQAWAGAVPRPWSVQARVWDRQGNLSLVTGTLP